MPLDFRFVLKSSNKLKSLHLLQSTVTSATLVPHVGQLKHSVNCFEFTETWYFIVPQNTDWPAAFLTNNWWLCSYLTFALELESVK